VNRARVVLDDVAFARLRRLLATVAGLEFHDSRRASLGCSVAERMRQTGARDVTTYLDLVSREGSAELQQLVDEVTIQETHFFRNPPQMRALRRHLLPELVRTAAARDKRLRIWSAGCSTGEEPYSLAMALRELLPSTAGWDVKVVGTDVSHRALAAAREGTYGPRALHATDPQDVARFFLPVSKGEPGRLRVRPEVRELVEFRHHNLVTQSPPFGAGERVDLVLCRNVTIYFSRDTTRSLMRRVHASLHDGGYLLLGHSETLWQLSDDFSLVVLGSGDSSAFVYRRGPVAPSPGALPAPRRTAAAPAPRPAVVPPDLSPDPVAGIRQALAAGRYDEAALLAAAAVAREPLRPELHYLHGLALVEGGHDTDAVPALRRAAYLDPDAGLPHFVLAGTLSRLGHDAAAAGEYRAAATRLGQRPAERTAPELGGRRVSELAQLCDTLAGQLSGR
jgi:chemotaxis protein methyltransferase CheR